MTLREHLRTAPKGAPYASPWLVFERAFPLKPYEPAQAGKLVEAGEPVEADDRASFLRAVSTRAHRVYREHYQHWYDRFADMTDALGAVGCLYRTVWRAYTGAKAHPAFECGPTLHRFLGFPYFAGSGVRGLLHAVAERKALDEALKPGETLDAALVQRVVRECDWIHAAFGSLTLREHVVSDDELELPPEVMALLGIEVEPPSPGRTPRTVLDRWLKSPEARAEEHATLRADATRLRDEHTGGWLVAYDAVPMPGQEQPLLELDILNPHYPDYFGDPAKFPPSDDQDPRPITFLAVRAGATFDFRLGVRGPTADESALENVFDLLDCALAHYGIGAKTAAGYGYFERSDDDEVEDGAGDT